MKSQRLKSQVLKGCANRAWDSSHETCTGAVSQQSCLQVSPLSFCSKSQSAFMVNPLTAQGVAVAIVDYDVAPKGDKGSPRRLKGLVGRESLWVLTWCVLSV